MNENEGRMDVVYFTAIPWVDFTQMKHASGPRQGRSIPQIAVGKLPEDSDSRLRMSVSIEANHGLADGRHIGQFFEKLAA